MSPSCSTPLRRSEAITGDNPRFQPNTYSTAEQVAILPGRRNHTVDGDYLRARSIFAMQTSVPHVANGKVRTPQGAATLIHNHIHNHNLATPYPHSRPNLRRQWVTDTTQKGSA
jgi:hypothetical protein